MPLPPGKAHCCALLLVGSSFAAVVIIVLQSSLKYLSVSSYGTCTAGTMPVFLCVTQGLAHRQCSVIFVEAKDENLYINQ